MKKFDYKKLKCIIFDCDGVLVDSEIIASRVSLNLLKQYGFEMDPREYAKTFAGKVEEDIMNIIIKEYNVQLPVDFISRLSLAIDHGLDHELQAIKGVKETLEGISLPIAVVSNSRLERVHNSLGVAGLPTIFGKRIYSAEMVANPKPAPDVYLLAAKELNVLPSQCLVVEDSKSGTTAAVLAGMNVIGFLGASHIPKGHDVTLLEAGAFTTVKDMVELKNTINEIIG